MFWVVGYLIDQVRIKSIYKLLLSGEIKTTMSGYPYKPYGGGSNNGINRMKQSQKKDPLISSSNNQTQMKNAIIQITKQDQDYLDYYKTKFLQRKNSYYPATKDWKSKQNKDLRKQVSILLDKFAQKSIDLSDELNTIHLIQSKQTTYHNFYSIIYQYLSSLKQQNFKKAEQILSTQLYTLPHLVQQLNAIHKRLQQFSKVKSLNNSELQNVKLSDTELQNIKKINVFYEQILQSIDDMYKLNNQTLFKQKVNLLNPTIRQKLIQQTYRLKNEKDQAQKISILKNEPLRWLKFFLSILGNDFDQQKVSFMLDFASKQLPASKQLTQTLKAIQKFCQQKRNQIKQTLTNKSTNQSPNKKIISSNQKLSSQQSPKTNRIQDQWLNQKIKQLTNYINQQFAFLKQQSVKIKLKEHLKNIQLSSQKFNQLNQNIINRINNDFSSIPSYKLSKQSSFTQLQKNNEISYKNQQKPIDSNQQMHVNNLSQMPPKLQTCQRQNISNQQLLQKQLIKVLNKEMTVLQLKIQFQQLMQKYQFVNSRKKQYQQDKQNNLQQISNKNQQIRSLKDRQTKMQQQTKRKINKLQQQLQKNIIISQKLKQDKKQQEYEIENLKNIKINLQNYNAKLKKDLLIYQEKGISKDQLQLQNFQLKFDLKLLNEKVSVLKIQNNRYKQAIKQKDAQIQTKQRQIKQLKQKIIQLQTQNQHKSTQINTRNIDEPKTLQQQRTVSVKQSPKQPQKRVPYFRSFNSSLKRQQSSPKTRVDRINSQTNLLSSTFIQGKKFLQQRLTTIVQNKQININFPKLQQKKSQKLNNNDNIKQEDNNNNNNKKIIIQTNSIQSQTDIKQKRRQLKIISQILNQRIDSSQLSQDLKSQLDEWIDKCTNYQKDIEQLTKNITELISNNKQLTQDNDQLTNSLDKLRQKHRQHMINCKSQLYLRIKLQKQLIQKQLQITKNQLQELKNKQNNQSNNINFQSMQNLQLTLNDKNNHVIEIQKTINHFINQNDQLKNNKSTLQQTIRNLNNQHQIILQNKIKQINILHQKTLQDKVTQLNKQHQIILQNKIKSLNYEHNKVNKQLQEKIKASTTSGANTNSGGNLQAQKKQLKMQILTLQLDLQQKAQHYDELSKKYKKQTTALKQQIQKLKTTSQSGIDNFKLKISKMQEEIVKLGAQNKNIRDKLNDESNSRKEEFDKMKKEHALQIKNTKLESARTIQETRQQIKSSDQQNIRLKEQLIRQKKAFEQKSQKLKVIIQKTHQSFIQSVSNIMN